MAEWTPLPTSPIHAYHQFRAQTLWEILGVGVGEIHPPRQPWWLNNHHRLPPDILIFQFVRRGRVIYRDSQGDREVKAGAAFLFSYNEETSYGRPPDRPDWAGQKEEIQTEHVTFRGAGTGEHWRLLRARFGSVVALPPKPASVAALHYLHEELKKGLRNDRLALARETAFLVLQIIGDIEAAASAFQSPADRAVDEILGAPFRAEALKEVAGRYGCSREHLTRVFIQRVGQAPARHLTQLRLERALLLLRYSDLPVAEIAVRCGAGSVHTLTRWIRAATGRSPSRYRKSAKEGS